jgi:hypothetical protein
MSTLHPLTRFVVAMSGLVPLVFSIPMLFAPGFWNDTVLPEPLAPTADETLRYVSAAYLSLTAGGIYTLVRNEWRVAQGFLAVAAPYVGLALVMSLVNAVSPGVPAAVWLYVALAVGYVVLVPIVWSRQRRELV